MTADKVVTDSDGLPRYVRIPDMFSSVMSLAPRVNPHYQATKREAEKWAVGILRLDEQQAAQCSKADITYVGAIWMPDADKEALRVVTDWLHWVFFFDDQFDEGHLKDDPEAAKEEVLATLATTADGHPVISAGENALRYIFQYTWFRFQKRASPDLQERYKQSIKDYFDGLLRQVGIASESITVGVEEFMHFRRSTIGVYPTHELMEYAQEIELPSHVFDHKAVNELRRISSDLVCLQNDVLSYRKDLALGVEHNIIHIYRKQGLSEQRALDGVEELFNSLYKGWYLALAEMPCWGEQTDREMLKYIDGCRDIALGNLCWSYTTGRYLGKEGEAVRKTRMMALP